MLKQQFELLKPGGILIHTTTSDDFLRHTWSSIDTNYLGNKSVENGESGRIKLTNRNLELESVCWQQAYLLSKFEAAGFELLELHQPLGQTTDPYDWQEELSYSPYNIFVLKS